MATMASRKRNRRLVEFRTHGPFVLSTAKNAHGREMERLKLRAFWDQAECGPIARRRGCYVFAIRTSKRFIPYYVGKTGVGFTRECFTPRNVTLYNRALALHGKSAKPVLFLICGMSGKNKARMISEIETFFIQHGADKNPQLLNVKGRPIAKWRIPGVLRSGGGKPSRAAKALRSTFGL